MNLISQIKEIKSKISGQITFNENLSKHSWFNLGGPAKVIFRPKNLVELSTFLKNIKGISILSQDKIILELVLNKIKFVCLTSINCLMINNNEGFEMIVLGCSC